MKSICFLALSLSLAFVSNVGAQEQNASKKKRTEVETKWPGVIFRIPTLERIQDNRLLVVVHIVATSKAAVSGTFLGTRPVIPTGTTRDELETNRYDGKPFSLTSAVMTDEQTLRKYSVLAPVAPPGQRYFPSELANGLSRGQAETLTIQFTAPPAPPLVEGEPAKQTVSFFLPGAKGPIVNVPVPPPEAKD